MLCNFKNNALSKTDWIPGCFILPDIKVCCHNSMKDCLESDSGRTLILMSTDQSNFQI